MTTSKKYAYIITGHKDGKTSIHSVHSSSKKASEACYQMSQTHPHKSFHVVKREIA